MTKREKLLARAHQAPNNLTLDEFETLLKQCGWVFKRQKGSHRVWLSPSNRALTIQSDGGKAKSYQVKQALLMMKSHGLLTSLNCRKYRHSVTLRKLRWPS